MTTGVGRDDRCSRTVSVPVVSSTRYSQCVVSTTSPCETLTGCSVVRSRPAGRSVHVPLTFRTLFSMARTPMYQFAGQIRERTGTSLVCPPGSTRKVSAKAACDRSIQETFTRTGASVLILHWRLLRARWAERAREAGMALVCYGVETRAHLRRLRARRLDGMITNNPALLGRLLEEIG